MKYFIIAGEASGDLHSAAVAEAIRARDKDAVLMGWGGDEMESAGVKVLKHYRELAFMGFVEVLKHLPRILRNFREVKAQIRAFDPDALILTDYPGFNLRMAKWAHRQGIRVFYYISPQLWAWKESRVKLVRKYVEHMYVILPFEKPFYDRHGIEVTYVGHPLARRIDRLRESLPDRDGQKHLVLLPGSRRREIADMLPVMLKAASMHPGYRVTVAGAPSIPAELYYEIIAETGVPGITLTFRRTYALLAQASVAFCTSGTATLETALFGVPQIVCYKGDRLSYLLARRLIRVPYIAMANLICNTQVIPELIQDDFNVEKLSRTFEEIMRPERLAQMKRHYADLHDMLDAGDPGARVAEDVIQRLKK